MDNPTPSHHWPWDLRSFSLSYLLYPLHPGSWRLSNQPQSCATSIIISIIISMWKFFGVGNESATQQRRERPVSRWWCPRGETAEDLARLQPGRATSPPRELAGNTINDFHSVEIVNKSVMGNPIPIPCSLVNGVASWDLHALLPPPPSKTK